MRRKTFDMDDRIWVGSTSRCPVGWSSLESLEAVRATAAHPVWVMVDDPAGVLREADFLHLYGIIPFARIERVVGPWRAGVGRTDPQWPLATLHRDDAISDAILFHAAGCLPLTSGYEDLAGGEVIPDLTGLNFGIEIGDPELRAMWADWLTLAGGLLSRAPQVDVLVRDNSAGVCHSQVSDNGCVVVLSADPWNAEPSPADFADDGVANSQRYSLTASVLDSPARVTQRLLAVLPRVAL